VAAEADVVVADSLSGKLTQLIEYLRQSRYLLILDNFESALDSQTLAGQYVAGCEGYGELLRLLTDTPHQSCLLLTSREKPQEIAAVEGEHLPVRSWQLSGLKEAGQLLQLKGITGSVAHLQELADRYSGNPLAINMVATSIQEIFEGNVAEFLAEGTAAFNGILKLFNQQLHRLMPLEREILYWLAINREPISLSQLQADVVSPISKAKLLEALESLLRRSLIERRGGKFTQQPVIMECLTTSLIEQMVAEIADSTSIRYLKTYAILKAQAPDYIREAQSQLIVTPIVNQLMRTIGTTVHIQQRLQAMLDDLRIASQRSAGLQPDCGYTAGNLLNLLCHLKTGLCGYDLSQLTIRQAYLANVPLQQVNFAHANLSTSVFPDVLSGISDVSFHPTQAIVATADVNGEIQLWDSRSGQQLLICKGHTRRVWAVSFNPDGERLASVSEDQTLRVWDVGSGQCLQCLQGHEDWVVSLSFAPDGETVATGSFDQSIKLWNFYTGECLKTWILEGSEDTTAIANRIWTIAFSPDGKTIASGDRNGTVTLWDIETETFKQFLGHQQAVYCLAWSPNGHFLASGSDDQTIRVWDVCTGDCLHQLSGHMGWIVKLSFMGDDALISSSSDSTVKFWQLLNGRCLKTLKGHTARTTIALAPDRQVLASASLDQTLKFWQVNTKHCLKSIQGYTNIALSIAVRPHQSDQFAVASSDGTVCLWRSTGQRIRTYKGHTSWVLSTAFDPSGTLFISGSSDYTAKIWQVDTAECLQTLQGHTSRIWSVGFSPNGQQVVTASDDRTVKLWSVSTGDCLRTLEGHTHDVITVDFSPEDQCLASGGADQLVKLWNSATGNCVQTWEGHSGWVLTLAFSPDGRTIATGSSDQTIRLWQVTTGKCLHILSGHTGMIWSVCFSPDGQWLASAGDDATVRLWNLQTYRCERQFAGHTKRIWSVDFCTHQSQLESQLISGGVDGTIRLWNLTENQKHYPQVFQNGSLCDRMNLAGASGLTAAQKASLKQLGASLT